MIILERFLMMKGAQRRHSNVLMQMECVVKFVSDNNMMDNGNCMWIMQMPCGCIISKENK